MQCESNEPQDAAVIAPSAEGGDTHSKMSHEREGSRSSDWRAHKTKREGEMKRELDRRRADRRGGKTRTKRGSRRAGRS